MTSFNGLVAFEACNILACHVILYSKCVLFPPLRFSQFNSISASILPAKVCNGESVDVDFISPQMWSGVGDNLYNFSVFDT